jgi:hypothetical protein
MGAFAAADLMVKLTAWAVVITCRFAWRHPWTFIVILALLYSSNYAS